MFNDQWEVVALHHAGVPAMDGSKQLLSLDNTPWKPEMGEQRIKWIANEGTRISTICAQLKALNASGAKARLLAELFDGSLEQPIEASSTRPDASTAVSASQDRDCGCGGSSPSVVGSKATWTIPLRVSVDLGCKDGEPAKPSTPSFGSISSPREPVRATEPTREPTDRELAEALAEAREASKRPYYSEAEDTRDRDAYYQGIDLANVDYDALSDLLQSTHTTKLKYRPAVHVYPWLDLQPNLKLKSVYSGKEYDPEEIIREDMRIEAARTARLQEMYRRESIVTVEALDVLEASLPYNCEHVVPQSWFEKREPMKGDLHHLFACESGCNSFRGNIPYFDFADFEETTRTDCGKREGNRFEPSAGKGAVARAVLYFILRYPGEVNATDKEYETSRIQTIIDWHKAEPISKYERHRNSVAFRKQGNRNPLIDFPELVDQIDFGTGLGD